MTDTDKPMRPRADARLRALAAQLAARRFEAHERDDTTLIVLEPDEGDGPRRGNTITCRARPDHDHRLWYFTNRDEPIAEVDDVDAVLRVAAHITTGTGVPRG
ncbi:hypothetical protein BJF79_07330 [Actinomadura sp. CNU-125]|uniref:hypothetical protein n=1 Tax=Actinomadura sp. CNU-125 TaxID=1904961 RepID=UPI00095E2FDF|nr:hypothetical protein [Actinomadura sp. CNU-125]OLT34373.1 hypothetical protein BJF79_07330 [Actinomadura sp. CNU-125]